MLKRYLFTNLVFFFVQVILAVAVVFFYAPEGTATDPYYRTLVLVLLLAFKSQLYFSVVMLSQFIITRYVQSRPQRLAMFIPHAVFAAITFAIAREIAFIVFLSNAIAAFYVYKSYDDAQ